MPPHGDDRERRVTRVANNPVGGKYLKGCRRGFSLPLEQNAPDRLLKPLVRDGERGSGRFREASWDEALRFAAERWARFARSSGLTPVLDMGSGGSTSALHATSPLLARFLNLFGGATALTGSYSMGAAAYVLPYILGEEWAVSGFDASTKRHSEMIVLWGANVLEARLGNEIDQRLMEAKRRGAHPTVGGGRVRNPGRRNRVLRARLRFREAGHAPARLLDPTGLCWRGIVPPDRCPARALEGFRSPTSPASPA